MSHTPGPWSIRPSGVPRTWVVSAGNYAIASVGGEDADARLIATAPELLEVARWVVNGMERDTLPWAVEGARKAVAKAEGREP